MNRLVIVGNGFDLNHGLKTSYKDFLFWYLEEALKSIFLTDNCDYSDKLLTIKATYQTDYSGHTINRKNGQEDYEEYINNTNRKPWSFLLNMKSRWFESLKIIFFPMLENIMLDVEAKGWTDIESDYYELLKKESNNTDACRYLNEQMDELRGMLANYLKTLPNVAQDSAIASFLADSIYLDDVAQCSIESAKPFVSKSTTFGERNDIRVNRTILLDFNYTNTTDNYLSDRTVINHIHGSINEPEKMIFGYGDELDPDFKMLENINNNELLRNSKSINYLETKHYRKLLGFMNGELFQVYVMGHSCGNSDRTLLNTIFEHENCISIKPFCYKNKDDNGIERDNYFELTQNIYRNFKDKTLFRDRVVNKEQCTTFVGKHLL